MEDRRTALLVLVQEVIDHEGDPCMIIDYSGPAAWNISTQGYQGPDHLPDYCTFYRVQKAAVRKIEEVLEQLGKKLEDIDVEDELMMKHFDNLVWEAIDNELSNMNVEDVSQIIKMLQAGCGPNKVYVQSNTGDPFDDLEEVFSERLLDHAVIGWSNINDGEVAEWFGRFKDFVSKVAKTSAVSTSGECINTYDQGFQAFVDGMSKEDNPYYSCDPDWKQWNDGWKRGESDAQQRMNEYCCGGADWPKYDFDMIVEIDGRRRRATIRFEWVDNSWAYYRAEPAHPKNITLKIPAKIKLYSEYDEIEFEKLSEKEQQKVLDAIEEVISGSWKPMKKKRERTKKIPINTMLAAQLATQETDWRLKYEGLVMDKSIEVVWPRCCIHFSNPKCHSNACWRGREICCGLCIDRIECNGNNKSCFLIDDSSKGRFMGWALKQEGFFPSRGIEWK